MSSFSEYMNSPEAERFQRRGKLFSRAFSFLCGAATLTCVLILLILVGSVMWAGVSRVNWGFITNYSAATNWDATGVYADMMGSLWLIALTALISVPLGVGAALYLEEYAAPSRWRTIVQINISNLAGVPSIVYGILGLGLFVRFMMMGRSVLAGALTLSLVVLPIVILAAQEALRAVPLSIRHASYALGATRWQTTWHQVLPAALPGIMTGIILAISRALGEAAPLVAVGGVTYVSGAPRGVLDEFSAMPMRIYYWAGLPNAEAHELAAAAIIVLLVVLILVNIAAVWVRHRSSKKVQW